ncbi:GTPase HflX [Rhizorhabdus dicambivorans]|uniref:GTPase HflX n=1 Tax=Rhizorhabdus dicambivorans TaxID=1850238 RepID=A0A2A4FY13_9SPHN|nr:GTPase HflX [Rhizorhabdus dicambivorans]ATE65363.1 GTPase HflX [Rhizorhabdus dicambivorans]PCE42308.1 GTPase HflX [Rhizorhabdus dicambivorans]
MSVFNREDDDGLSRGARALVALPERAGDNPRSAEARLDEAAGLAAAIGVDVVEKLAFRLRDPKPATLFGSGQVDQIALAARMGEAELIIVDAALTPIQQRNLEKATEAKVIDRTGLILEIFGERAATAEGRLQVELAHLDYQAGRLVRSWTHLERQRGGFGFLGGPGETQIEADRRLIRDRMAKLRRELEQVRRTRGLHRARRQRAPWPVIALVGYTNAGKSTLFNRMTGAKVMAEDLLFATLDPTMRQISLPGLDKAILSDTVGFVSDLPTQLVAAFRATLEEVTGADIILHVRDIAHPDSDAQAGDVLAVLGEIGVGPKAPDAEAGEGAPIIEVWNKIDMLDEDSRAATLAEAERREDVVTLSALTGDGVEDLRRFVSDRLSTGNRVRTLSVPVGDGAALAWLHANGEVIGQEVEGDMMIVEVRLSDKDLARFEAR